MASCQGNNIFFHSTQQIPYPAHMKVFFQLTRYPSSIPNHASCAAFGSSKEKGHHQMLMSHYSVNNNYRKNYRAFDINTFCFCCSNTSRAPLRDGFSKKEVTREVPHSNKNQLNPIHSFSSHSFKKIFTQGCSKIVYASIPGGIFVLHCSTKQKFFGATWLGLQSGKFKNIETLDFFPQCLSLLLFYLRPKNTLAAAGSLQNLVLLVSV